MRVMPLKPKARYTLPVSTGRVHGPYRVSKMAPVFTGRHE